MADPGNFGRPGSDGEAAERGSATSRTVYVVDRLSQVIVPNSRWTIDNLISDDRFEAVPYHVLQLDLDISFLTLDLAAVPQYEIYVHTCDYGPRDRGDFSADPPRPNLHRHRA